MFNLFIENCYDNAIELKRKFRITQEKEWDAMVITNELVVQLGHYSYIICKSQYTRENGRKINNVGDELSDILLQLCALCGKLNIDKKSINEIKPTLKSNVDATLQLVTLIGQITEAIMELEKYRHNKERCGYNNKKEFIIDRICKCFSIIFWIAGNEKINMILEYKKMERNAMRFLKKYNEK